jgi:hypothetical protein
VKGPIARLLQEKIARVTIEGVMQGCGRAAPAQQAGTHLRMESAEDPHVRAVRPQDMTDMDDQHSRDAADRGKLVDARECGEPIRR